MKTYQSQPNKYVESFLWVKKCVEDGEVTYTPVVYKNPGGRRAGEEYVPPLPARHYSEIRFADVHISLRKTRRTYATGLQPRFHSRKQEDAQAIDSTNS